MSKTTIEIPTELREQLKDERLPHESNYGDTIRRLLDDGTGRQLWSEDEIRSLAREEIADMSVKD